MFGYIVINKPEIKFREFDVYRSYYCGFCRELKHKYGLPGQATLSYDLTFRIMLLTGLYEPEDQISATRCAAHPLEKHVTRINAYSEYAADMNIMLAYYKSLDDWTDEHKSSKFIFSRVLSGDYRKAVAKYPDKAKIIFNGLEQIHTCEKAGDTDVDKVAGYFGQIMAEIFCYRDDEWAGTLRQIGFYLGKFIYLLDAYDDIEKDIKTGNYNPFRPKWENDPEHFDEYCNQILTMMISECSRAFETLPILENISILRNILYSGVWTRYEIVRHNRMTQQKDETQNV